MTQTEAVRKSECVACAPGGWVLRCAHFDGRWVILHGYRYQLSIDWFVCYGTGVGPGREWPHLNYGAANHYHGGSDEAAALAAFHEAEEKLLRCAL